MSTEEQKNKESESEATTESESEEEANHTPKKISGLPSILIPKNFVKIDVVTILELQKSKDTSVVFIDVRDVDFVGGNIPGAVHVPYQEFDPKVTELVQKYGKYKHVIFYCLYGQLRSPSCALGFIKKLEDTHHDDLNNVFVLSGGFHEYLLKNLSNLSALDNYDSACWTGPELLHIHDADVNTFRPKT